MLAFWRLWRSLIIEGRAVSEKALLPSERFERAIAARSLSEVATQKDCDEIIRRGNEAQARLVQKFAPYLE